MPKYLFSVGNSSDGPIGFCARIEASNEPEALAILRNELRSFDAKPGLEVSTDEYCVEYLTVYFNADYVTLDDILDVEPDEKPLDPVTAAALQVVTEWGQDDLSADAVAILAEALTNAGVAVPDRIDDAEPAACECDNTHRNSDTVCRWCWERGRRQWSDPPVAEADAEVESDEEDHGGEMHLAAFEVAKSPIVRRILGENPS